MNVRQGPNSTSCHSALVAAELTNLSGITVVTNNIEILSFLSQSELHVISSGGHLSKTNRNCLIGADAERTFSEIRANIMFFSAKALSEDGIIYDCDREEICLRRVMMQAAGKKIFLCESEKYGQTAGYCQCGIGEIDCLVTETAQRERFKALEGGFTCY